MDFATIQISLNSDDPAERRETAENLLSEEINLEIAKALVAKMTDTDKGVRDAISMTLAYNDFETIPELVVPFISSEEISVRNLAGEILVRRGLNSIPAMMKYLRTSDDDDQKFIIDIFALIGDDAPVEMVKNILIETQNENVALACIEALGSMKAEGAIEELKKAFDKNELYRPTIAETFGKIGSASALEFLIERYDEIDELSRFSVLESFGEIGDQQTFYFILSKLKNAQPPLNWAIVSSLNALKDRLGLEIPFDETTKHAILNTLSEADLKYRQSAAALLTLYRDAEVLNACINAYGSDPEIDGNLQAILIEQPSMFYTQLIDKLRQTQHNLRSLLELLKQTLDMDGGEGLKTLGGLELHNLTERLSECLTNPNEEVRRFSMELLFSTNRETAFVFLDTMLSDSNTWNKLLLVDILEQIEDPRSNDGLRTLAADSEEMIQQRAEWVLSQRS